MVPSPGEGIKGATVFLRRHRDRLGSNFRLSRQYSTLGKLGVREELIGTAERVINACRSGQR